MTVATPRSRILRWSLRLLTGLLLLLALASLALWLALRGSLPQLDDARALRGLSMPATVSRDALGVVTVDAANITDAARAIGFVHGQERPFEMDLLRRTSAGELSELFGAVALEVDRAHRLHRLRARMRATLETLSPAERAQLAAYSDGVNQGVAALRVRPWPYLLLRQTPRAWQPEDSLLVGMAMYFDLQDSAAAHDQAYANLQPHLPPAILTLLRHAGSTWDAPLTGASFGDATLPSAADVDLRTLAMPGHPAHPVISTDIAPGSNNFAATGDATRGGRAILANDMHLSLRAPALWFRARLRYADAQAAGGRVDATGFMLPGLPFIITGSNGHVAWGFTNAYADTADLKAIVPCGAGATSACDVVRRHVETLYVAGAPDETLNVDETDWGPVLPQSTDGQHWSLRWVAEVPGAMSAGLADMVLARDLDQALTIARTLRMPVQNMLLADANGRIAWHLVGALPQRGPGCDDTLPVQPHVCAPWSVGTESAPELVDPAKDRLWTANNRNVDGAALARLGNGGYALGARAGQIRDGLNARAGMSERDLLAIQLDDRALFLQRWQALLVQLGTVSETTPRLRELAHAAAAPMPRASVESTSYPLVRAWRLAVLSRLADGLTAPAQATMGDSFRLPDLPQFEGVAWPLVTQRALHLLPRRFASWNALFEDAATEVQRAQSTANAPRNWGERNRANICHPLARALPFARRALCMPFDPLPGDVAMPRVAAPSFGASQRMVVSPGHEADGIAQMPGGQSGHPLSPFWGAGHAAWVQGRPTPFLPGPASHRLSLQPR